MSKGGIGILAVLGGIATISVTGFNVMGSAVAQITVDNATMSGNMTGVRFLFIQGAQSGSVSEVNATTSTLELRDVSDKTILFSDRPDRKVSSVDTTNFIGNWSVGPDSFASDPPNAVLILDDEVRQRQDFAIIELFNPGYDSEANTLSYDIKAENSTATTTSSIGLPIEFGQSTLVIDDQYNITFPNNSVNYSNDIFQKSP
ncbi:MAG TPA: hypothetical protein VFR94_17475 [Nitrososphaeraceae archaeon]|nr:hypothetical protein [Nitrososphaeraceae archaeon]